MRLKRSALDAMPICSIIVRPALGTYSSASFSDGSMVMRYSPVIVGIDELDDDVVADALDPAVAPFLERDRSTWCRRLLRSAARRCRPRDAIRFRRAGRR